MAQSFSERPPQPMAQTSTMAVVSLVAGITAFVMFPVIGAIVAVITGHMAKREIAESMGRLTGDGLATTGLVLGYIHLGLGLLGICLVFLLIALGTVPFFCIPFTNQFGMWLVPLFGF
jgi:hypothetical protein